MLKDKYTEIFKLKNMFEKANIPFEFNIITNRYDHLYGLGERYQICYPDAGPNIKCSIIEGKGTYGAEEDLLEIMGLLTQKEQMNDNVLGYLNAQIDNMTEEELYQWLLEIGVEFENMNNNNNKDEYECEFYV